MQGPIDFVAPPDPAQLLPLPAGKHRPYSALILGVVHYPFDTGYLPLGYSGNPGVEFSRSDRKPITGGAQRYMQPHQREVTHILSYLAESTHELVSACAAL